MRLVLDSSVAVKWVLEEPGTEKALELRGDFLAGRHELIAPDVFAVEMAHALAKALRQRRLEPDDCANMLADVLS